MEQQDKELDLAVGRECPICDTPMQKHGNRPHSATRDHLRPRRLGSTLACFDGRNKKIICRACNVLKRDDSLVVFLLRLMRDADAVKAEGVAGMIADLYACMDAEEADALVGMSVQPPPISAPKKPKQRNPLRRSLCSFPSCECVARCQHAPP